MTAPSREVPIDPAHAALLIIDVQNYCVRPGVSATEYFRYSLQDSVLPNIRRLQSACRSAGIEIVYSIIENMTRNGRDRSLDYKISGIDVLHGSQDARVLDEVSPVSDEMVFHKTSSSVFISTNIDYVLRNLEVRSLIVTGIMTALADWAGLTRRIGHHSSRNPAPRRPALSVLSRSAQCRGLVIHG
jgi:ureidoacrylate peracid hydrolase